MIKRKLLSIVLVTILPFLVAAQQSHTTKWTVKNPFEQKVFIENKGQYELTTRVNSNEILYGAQLGGLQYYFTKNAIWIKKNISVKLTGAELEQLNQAANIEGETDNENENASKFKTVEEFHQMQFIGANPTAEITSENEVSWYYNFTINKNTPVKAQAYKKLIYRNLYTGIDMEFYFPEDKQGFEYSFIVHPGADVSQIKIQYPLNEGLQFDGQGNLVIKSTYGDFIDHSPVANQSRNTIGCSFSLNNSQIQFNIKDYDKTQDLVIDPWTITPTFAGTNDAYDVDWDNDGNCYAYGGGGAGGLDPFQLLKFDNNGKMLWSFSEDFTSTAVYYGGFAVDKYSQSAYLVEGFNFNSGAGVIKVNSAGTQIAFFPGNTEFREMWRIAFSKCTNSAVIAGGGTSSPSYQACFLDTNLVNLSPVNVLNNTQECCHDMWGIALDNFGNAFTATVTTTAGNDYENVILKLPLPSLSPTTWMVSDNYDFIEAQSDEFAIGSEGPPNGFNGMTVSDTSLYTYDSYILKKWSTNSGVEINSATINTTFNNSVMHWAGLASNDCGDIFLGSINKLIHFSSDLKALDTTSLTDTVYDVKLGKNNILYAGGAGFISAVQVNLSSCGDIKITNQVTQGTCSSDGSATVNISGGTPPYSISWNTTPPQTTTTISGLTEGTYIATILDNSCSGVATAYDTVNITSPGNGSVFIPTAFTPDVPGVNAVFKPNLSCNSYSGYEFKVFNRWGRMVFSTTSPDMGWDGKYNGTLQPLDVYVYYIKFSCGTCNAFKKGNVTLLK